MDKRRLVFVRFPYFASDLLVTCWECVIMRNVPLCSDPEVLSPFFILAAFSGDETTSVSVTIYTLFHHKELRVTHAHTGKTHTHPPSTSCLIQTCLMSPLTDPHRVSSTHAHRHSITGKQRRPHINPSSKASSRPFPMRMRCPKACWCYLAPGKGKNVIYAPNCCRGRFYKHSADRLKAK